MLRASLRTRGHRLQTQNRTSIGRLLLVDAKFAPSHETCLRPRSLELWTELGPFLGDLDEVSWPNLITLGPLHPVGSRCDLRGGASRLCFSSSIRLDHGTVSPSADPSFFFPSVSFLRAPFVTHIPSLLARSRRHRTSSGRCPTSSQKSAERDADEGALAPFLPAAANRATAEKDEQKDVAVTRALSEDELRQLHSVLGNRPSVPAVTTSASPTQSNFAETASAVTAATVHAVAAQHTQSLTDAQISLLPNFREMTAIPKSQSALHGDFESSHHWARFPARTLSPTDEHHFDSLDNIAFSVLRNLSRGEEAPMESGSGGAGDEILDADSFMLKVRHAWTLVLPSSETCPCSSCVPLSPIRQAGPPSSRDTKHPPSGSLNPTSPFSAASFGSSTFKCGDWVCVSPTCNFHNYSRNQSCVACGTPKPSRPSMRSSNSSLPPSPTKEAVSFAQANTTSMSLRIGRSSVTSFYPPENSNGAKSAPSGHPYGAQLNPPHSLPPPPMSLPVQPTSTELQASAANFLTPDYSVPPNFYQIGFGSAYDTPYAGPRAQPMQREASALPPYRGGDFGSTSAGIASSTPARTLSALPGLSIATTANGVPVAKAPPLLPAMNIRNQDVNRSPAASSTALSTAAKLASLGVSVSGCFTLKEREEMPIFPFDLRRWAQASIPRPRVPKTWTRLRCLLSSTAVIKGQCAFNPVTGFAWTAASSIGAVARSACAATHSWRATKWRLLLLREHCWRLKSLLVTIPALLLSLLSQMPSHRATMAAGAHPSQSTQSQDLLL